MAGDRFMFMTYSDDNLGVVIKSDDQKNKKADGTGVTKGNIYFDSYIHGKGVVPVGAVIAFGGTGTSGTPGWIICDGRKLNKGTYPKLFSVLGYAHGGSGTYFNLPDLRGRVVAGYSTSSSLTSTLSNCNKMGNKQGSKTHTLSTSQMPKHSHAYVDTYYRETWSRSGKRGIGSRSTDYDNYDYNYSRTTSNSGSGSAHNNVQPTIVLHYFIRVL